MVSFFRGPVLRMALQACAGGRKDVVDWLLHQPGVTVNSQDEVSRAAVLAATLYRSAVSVLQSGWTPLASAASAGFVPLVRFLLDAGADPNVPNESGQVPLHHHKGNLGVIDLLLPVTKSIDCRDASGVTPLCRACQQGKIDAARALLAAGADVNVATKAGASLCTLHLSTVLAV